jgi:spore coat protein U-like protein
MPIGLSWHAITRRSRSVLIFLRRRPEALLVLAADCLSRPAWAINCSLSVANVAFGSVSLLGGAAQDVTSTGTITCSGGAALTTYIFCINIYQGSNANGSQRNMASGALKLPYALYSDPLYSVPWGSWTGAYLSGGVQVLGASLVTGAISLPVTIYAQIPAGQQAASVGTYMDTLPGSASQTLQYAAYGGAGYTACPLTGSAASTAQFGFSAAATIASACTVQSGSLAFASTSVLSATEQGTGSVSVACSGAAPYSVGLGPGTYASGSQRRMYSAVTNNYVAYNLYTDAADTSPWSTTLSATSCTNGTGTCALGIGSGSYQTVPVYGTVPAQAAAAAGSYADSVTVTVTY